MTESSLLQTGWQYQLLSRSIGYSQLSIFTGSCIDLVCVANVQGAADYGYGSKLNGLAAKEFLAENVVNYRIILTGEHFDTRGDYEFKINEVQ